MHVTPFISTHISLNSCTSSVAEFCDSTMGESTAKAFHYPHSNRLTCGFLLYLKQVFCQLQAYYCELFTYKYFFYFFI